MPEVDPWAQKVPTSECVKQSVCCYYRSSIMLKRHSKTPQLSYDMHWPKAQLNTYQLIKRPTNENWRLAGNSFHLVDTWSPAYLNLYSWYSSLANWSNGHCKPDASFIPKVVGHWMESMPRKLWKCKARSPMTDSAMMQAYSKSISAKRHDIGAE